MKWLNCLSQLICWWTGYRRPSLLPQLQQLVLDRLGGDGQPRISAISGSLAAVKLRATATSVTLSVRPVSRGIEDSIARPWSRITWKLDDDPRQWHRSEWPVMADILQELVS